MLQHLTRWIICAHRPIYIECGWKLPHYAVESDMNWRKKVARSESRKIEKLINNLASLRPQKGKKFAWTEKTVRLRCIMQVCNFAKRNRIKRQGAAFVSISEPVLFEVLSFLGFLARIIKFLTNRSTVRTKSWFSMFRDNMTKKGRKMIYNTYTFVYEEQEEEGRKIR